MSGPNFFSKLNYKVLSLRNFLRVMYYKLLGMKIGAGIQLEKISVQTPSNVQIGSNCIVKELTNFWIQSPFNSSNRIIIGDNVFIGRNTEFNCCSSIIIGNNCLIASSTVFVDSSHTFSKNQFITEQSTLLSDIVVEEDVWIGTGCKILFGVRLGKGCIIGAGAVVNKSVPPYETWAGVPARKIGERK